ncbi:RDD family protein [Thalassotalea sp. M1531]|uniref:RDD family protein n=1 Tax=Thalassotalea algicola TaxID=2716224 RepID=A0A7Y0LE41_9GAMM|nr:RDD family protein [Thalassotalea algicola]NMP32504.1 RDD family protein [Thalassotalea algicola]
MTENQLQEANNKPEEQALIGETQALDRQETRQILTPFAFEIDKTLFGLPLAKPWKRGVALLVDLMLIAMLSSAPGELLAVVIAVTAYRLGSKKRAEQMGKVKGQKRRAIMRGIGAFILLVMLLDTLPSLFGQLDSVTKSPETPSNSINSDELDLKTTLKIASLVTQATTIAQRSQCENVDCWRAGLSDIVSDVAWLAHEKGLDEIDTTFADLVEETNLTTAEQKQLVEGLKSDFNKEVASLETNKISDKEVQQEDQDLESTNASSLESVISKEGNNIASEEEKDSKPIYSIMELVKGIIEDLGLGFGWAAFYFTVFTALWQGQTPGKRLLGIKVIQLDGTPLSIWDSFGRYGGYGAGIATGLLGFIQIFWDANRQAIHDQISATVVIDK